MPLSQAAWARIVPFALFMSLLALRGALPEENAWGLDPRWIYALNLVVVGGALAWFWRAYGEFARQNRPTAGEAGLSVVVGLVVFGLWISLDAPWMRLGDATAPFVPTTAAGTPDWPLIAVRWIGASIPELRACGRSCSRPSSSCSRTRCGWRRSSPARPMRGSTSAPASCGRPSSRTR
jgi:uncharacterized protein